MRIKDMVFEDSAYNLWANTKLSKWLLTLKNEEPPHLINDKFHQNFDSIVTHIITAENYWCSKITMQPLILPAIDPEKNLYQQLRKQSLKVHKAIEGFDENHLYKKVQISLELSGKPIKSEQYIYQLIQHLVNHSTYHRGQLVILARSHGLIGKIPPTDRFIYTMGTNPNENRIQ